MTLLQILDRAAETIGEPPEIIGRIDDPGSEPVEPTDIPPRNPGEPLWEPDEDNPTQIPGEIFNART